MTRPRPGHRMGSQPFGSPANGPPPQPQWAAGPSRVILYCPECGEQHPAASIHDADAILRDLTNWYLSHWIKQHFDMLQRLRPRD